jgi:serine/threonine-protein kinase
MNPDRLVITEPVNHPADETLRALSLGQLTEMELTQVSAHLGACPACCSRIDQLATDDPLLAQLQRGAASREVELVTPAQRRPAVHALWRGKDKECPAPAPLTLHPPSSTLHPPAPRQVGDYDILAEAGRGGMGVVYKARHRGLRRLAALKMVLAGEFASPEQELRFRLEAELAARVQHPNIVQVYEIGSYEGRPFLAMEWVEGGSLANRLDTQPWPPGEAAALIEMLARAIDVAHEEGVVHRDLKPANILLVEGGGSRVEGKCTPPSTFHAPPSTLHRPLSTLHPKITDFGLARSLEGGKTLLQSGFLVGTPGYMAPEQAGEKRARVGPATDIYALGVMLYRLLTGQLPFQNDDILELLRALTSDEPPRPRRLQPRVPPDLEAITLHCLEKEPGRRYPTALALAEDLRRFREGKSVTARPVGEIGRLWRWCRRKPVIAGLLATLVLILSLGSIGMSWAFLVAESARQAENEKRREADEQRDRAERTRDRALQALDAMTSSVTGDSLTTQKQISDEQKKFLAEVLTYYQEFAGEQADDEPSRCRTAGAAFRVGLIEHRLGREAEAAAANRLACDGFARLAADFPDVPEYREGLAKSRLALGLALHNVGKRPEAEEQDRKALAVLEKLAADFSSKQEYRYELARSHANLGMVLCHLGKWPEAEDEYREALAGWEKLAAEFPGKPEYRYELAGSHSNLGMLLDDLGKRPEPEDHFRKALALQEKLAAEFPGKPEYRYDLAGSHSNLGALLRDLGKDQQAEEEFRKAVVICEKLTTDFPSVPAYQVALGGFSSNLGGLLRVSSRPSNGLVWFEKAIRTLTAVYEQDRRLAEAGQFLRNSYAERARAYGLLGKYAEAVRDMDRAVELSPNKEQPRYRAERAALRLQAGQTAEAVAETAELLKTPNWNAGQWYDFACFYAVASGKLSDKKQEYADRAMELLQQAVKAGYRDAAHMKQDSDLDSLRGRDDFKRLLAELGK